TEGSYFPSKFILINQATPASEWRHIRFLQQEKCKTLISLVPQQTIPIHYGCWLELAKQLASLLACKLLLPLGDEKNQPFRIDCDVSETKH
ncbi:MAG: hypothetical protein WBP77_17735, partial [Candidatus Sulfotelmatobacter sp.]